MILPHDGDDATRFGKRQRPKHHGIDDSENGGTAANAKSKYQDPCNAEPRVAPKHPNGVTKILQQASQHEYDPAAWECV
jgi:hypothetical protein